MNFTFDDFQNHKEHYKNKKNFDLAERSKKISFFHEEDKIIHIETPVVKDNFSVKQVFNISTKNYKAILVHISDGSISPSREGNRSKIMKIDFNFEEIINVDGAEDLNIMKKDNIYVVIFNENNPVSTSNIDNEVYRILKRIIISNLKFKEKAIKIEKGIKSLEHIFKRDPLEGGGGVIIRNP